MQDNSDLNHQITLNKRDGDFIDFLLSRRSTLARDIQEPEPSKEDLVKILSAGARVPDHGKLTPWRFKVFEKEAREKLGTVIAEAIKSEKPDCTEMTLRALQALPCQAPVFVAVISTPIANHKIPVWEQHLSAGAACQNILLAAKCLGYAAQWITGAAAYSEGVEKYFEMNEDDKIAGFIFIGSPAKSSLKERPRPDLNDLISWA